MDEHGINADGSPITEVLENGLLFPGKKRWVRPLTILTAGDSVRVNTVNVYRVTAGDNAQGVPETLEQVLNNALLLAIDKLPAGTYYLCFETYAEGPYAPALGRTTYRMDYTIYKVTLQ